MAANLCRIPPISHLRQLISAEYKITFLKTTIPKVHWILRQMRLHSMVYDFLVCSITYFFFLVLNNCIKNIRKALTERL